MRETMEMDEVRKRERERERERRGRDYGDE